MTKSVFLLATIIEKRKTVKSEGNNSVEGGG